MATRRTRDSSASSRRGTANTGPRLASGPPGSGSDAPLATYASAPTIVALARAYPSLPRSERQVADFILSHPSEVPRLTSTQLAGKVGVSQSIVSRLCIRVYDGGYASLRIGLAQELGMEAAHHQRAASGGVTDSEATAGDPRVHEILRRTSDDLALAERSVALLDHGQLHDTVALLCDARGICVCGMSLSGAVGHRFASLLHLEGLPARFEREPYHPPCWSLGLGPGSVLVVFSYRGDAPALTELISQSREQGATLLVITNEPRSRLAQKADMVLATSAPPAVTSEDYISGPALYVQIATARAVWMAVHAELVSRQTTPPEQGDGNP